MELGKNKKFYYTPKNARWNIDNTSVTFDINAISNGNTYYPPKYEMLRLEYTNAIKSEDNQSLKVQSSNFSEYFLLTEFFVSEFYITKIVKEGSDPELDDELLPEYYGIFMGQTQDVINGEWETLFAHNAYPGYYKQARMWFTNTYESEKLMMKEKVKHFNYNHPTSTFPNEIVSNDFGVVFYEVDNGFITLSVPGAETALENKHISSNLKRINYYKLIPVLDEFTIGSDDYAGAAHGFYTGRIFKRWGTDKFNFSVGEFSARSSNKSQLEIYFKSVLN